MNNKSLVELLNHNETPRYTKISDLAPGIPYLVVKFRITTSKHGPAVVATLEDDRGLLTVYLPNRFNDTLTEEIVAEYNCGNKNRIRLIYKGVSNYVEFAEV